MNFETQYIHIIGDGLPSLFGEESLHNFYFFSFTKQPYAIAKTCISPDGILNLRDLHPWTKSSTADNGGLIIWSSSSADVKDQENPMSILEKCGEKELVLAY